MRVEGVEVLKFSGEGALRRAEAGIRPGGRPPFLCATRKEAKKRAPQPAAPAGHTCAGVLAGCAVELTARCALRSDNHGESDHEAGVSCGTPPPPQAPRRRRSQKGVGSLTRAVAALGLACAAHSACGPLVPSAAMARRDVGLPPLLYAPAARRGWRIRARDCLSAAGASSSEAPPAPSTAGCPERSAGTQTAASPFFWVLFFGEAKNTYLARRGETRPPPSAKRTVTTRPCMGSSPHVPLDRHPLPPRRPRVRA